MAVMEEEAKELLSYFNHLNVDALLRLTRNTLEMLRKRINTPSAMHFVGGSSETSMLVSLLWHNREQHTHFFEVEFER